LLVLDLNGVSFIDSAGLHSLFRLARARGAKRLALVVDDAAPIARVVEIVELRKAAPVATSYHEAARCLSDGMT
jgi:anti-anti-sigma factor